LENGKIDFKVFECRMFFFGPRCIRGILI